MTTIPEGQPHTEAVLATLRAAGVTVGNASGAGLTSPYCVLYTDVGALDGPLGDRFADLTQTLFVHGIGTGPEQAQWEADKARVALLTMPITVAGRAVLSITHVTSQPARRDDAVQPPLFYAVDQYRLATTPA
jgi:hypothetical protein